MVRKLPNCVETAWEIPMRWNGITPAFTRVTDDSRAASPDSERALLPSAVRARNDPGVRDVARQAAGPRASPPSHHLPGPPLHRRIENKPRRERLVPLRHDDAELNARLHLQGARPHDGEPSDGPNGEVRHGALHPSALARDQVDAREDRRSPLGAGGEVVRLSADGNVVGRARIGRNDWVDIVSKDIQHGVGLWVTGPHGHTSHRIAA
jgi:hypothetical protein